MSYLKQENQSQRRGAMVVLAAVFIIILMGMIAFAVDVGYLGMVRTELQAAADSAALAAAGSSDLSSEEMVAVAQQFANANRAAGRHVQLNPKDVELGTWDAGTRTFSPIQAGQVGTAVKVTVRTDPSCGGSTALFFGRLFGVNSVDQEASAVAAVNPRDIAFVVDLSGSMNDDSTPGSSTSTTDLLQDVYDDFGFGTYPGNAQYAGQPLGIPNSSSWVYYLTRYGGPLRSSSIPTRYRVTNWDSSSTRTWKAYAWVMEVQLPAANLMPNLIPVPNAGSTANYNYWKSFIDSYRSSLGYKNYVRMMMDEGRNGTVGGSYTPLSLQSNLCNCPMHNETVYGESFSFPPSEMPTNAARRAMIAALQVIRDRNQTVSDVNQKDWVSIIAFDTVGTEAVKWSLGNKDNYSGAMQTCTQLQANGWTATEAGLYLAYDHIKPQSQGGFGREHANKIVVLLTDGMPNQKRSALSTSSIYNYIYNNPSVWQDGASTVNNWYTSGSYYNEKNAALMNTSIMQGDNWYVYAAAIGRGCDYDFMDRLARMGSTANNQGLCPRGSDDPKIYEAVLRQIFTNIITNPKLRLVQ